MSWKTVIIEAVRFNDGRFGTIATFDNGEVSSTPREQYKSKDEAFKHLMSTIREHEKLDEFKVMVRR